MTKVDFLYELRKIQECFSRYRRATSSKSSETRNCCNVSLTRKTDGENSEVSRMTTTREILLKALEELNDQRFKVFKWHLKESGAAGGHIPVAQLDGAERHDTVDLMVQRYHSDGALEKAAVVFEKMSRNDLSKELRTRGPQNPKNKTNNSKLGETSAEIQQMIEERRKKIWEVQKSAETSRKSAEQQIRSCKKVSTLLQELVEESMLNLVKEIEKTQKSTQEEANALIQELEQELSMLVQSTKKEMLPSKVHSNLIPQFSGKKWMEVGVSQPSYGRVMLTTVDLLKEKLTQQMDAFTAEAKLSRAQQFATDVTLDPETAHPNLILSHDGKQVYGSNVEQNLPDNPKRFNKAINALGKQGFSSGRFYYEVQVEGKTSWDLGVAQESVNRKGSITLSPENGFWTIGLSTGGKYQTSTAHLNVKSPLKKVGVFVDYEKGLVSFFDVHSANIIHRFKECSFTENLYPFFSPGTHRGGQNAHPLIICPVGHNG